jgi:ABC-2 type transport system ATP-binding protein
VPPIAQPKDADNAAVAVRLENMRVTRGSREVLPGVTLSLRRGEVTGLLGPSGSGKTTLMRAIVGVQAKVRGTVEVLGLPAGAAQLRDRIGYMTQATSVYSDLTVAENLAYFAAIQGVGSKRVATVVEQVDLGGHVNDRVAQLSGGERSRVSLAIALLGKAEVLVLDEPTVGLDPVLRQSLWSVFRALAGAGACLLVSSHVMDEASRCDRLILLREGRVLADTTPSGLLELAGTSNAEDAFLALERREAGQ